MPYNGYIWVQRSQEIFKNFSPTFILVSFATFIMNTNDFLSRKKKIETKTQQDKEQ